MKMRQFFLSVYEDNADRKLGEGRSIMMDVIRYFANRVAQPFDRMLVRARTETLACRSCSLSVRPDAGLSALQLETRNQIRLTPDAREALTQALGSCERPPA